MANQRSKDQQLLAFTLDAALAASVDSVSRARGENRSQFIRLALVNYLREIGHPVSGDLSHAPDRRMPTPMADSARLNDAVDAPPVPPEPRRPVDYKKALAADAKARKKASRKPD